MMLKCLGSRPLGRRPVFVEEISKLVSPGEIIDGKDATWSSQILEKYKGCFEVMEEPKPIPPVWEHTPQKMKRQQRDKMLQTAVEKEFE